MNKYVEETEESGRTMTLLKAIEQIEKLECELERKEKCLDIAEKLIKELAFGYQSRKQYNKLISAARFYFEHKNEIKELEK